MRTSFGPVLGLTLAVLSTPAFADEAPAATPDITINGTAAVVSDYRFRGISQTDRNFAVQGSLTLTHKSGFYLSVWGSSVDDYVTVTGTSHQEIDLIGGFKKTFSGTTFDIGALYYIYPRTSPAGDISRSNLIEPYVAVSHTFGPVTAKATVNYAPKQKALALDQGATGLLPNEDNVYIAGDFSGGIPSTPISLSAHVGHTFGPSWFAIGKGYTDWNVGVSYTWKQLSLGVQYVDANADFPTPSGKNASKAGVVGTIGVSF
jgi:uncharacterized protein (TIGR02001 family)